MYIVWGFAVAASLVLSYMWYPRDKRDLRTVITTGGVLGGMLTLGIYITQIWPVEHIEIKKIQKQYVDPPKVVYKDKIVYKDPSTAFKTIDPREVCKGSAPVKILQMLVNDPDTNERRTYLTVDVIGTGVTITCEVPGDLRAIWKPDMVVQMSQGKSL